MTLILADRTLGSSTPLEHLAIAAELGFDAVSLRVAPSLDDQPFVPAGSALMRQVLSRLAATGLVAFDAESVRLTPTSTTADFRAHIEGAAELGARFLLVVGDDPDEARATDSLTALAEEAARSGVRIALEFMAYVGVNSLQQANRVLDGVGRADAALLVDALHLHRAGGRPADLAAIPPARLPYYQLCDAWAEPGMELRAEARSGRLAPGAGDLPLVELARALPADAAVSIEVPNAALQAKLGDRAWSELNRDAALLLLHAARQGAA